MSTPPERKKWRADRDVRLADPLAPRIEEVREAHTRLVACEGYDAFGRFAADQQTLRNNLPALLTALEALRNELNTEHPYRELWEAAEEELGRLRATLARSTRSDGSERDRLDPDQRKTAEKVRRVLGDVDTFDGMTAVEAALAQCLAIIDQLAPRPSEDDVETRIRLRAERTEARRGECVVCGGRHRDIEEAADCLIAWWVGTEIPREWGQLANGPAPERRREEPTT